jgi:hypothetical protein
LGIGVNENGGAVSGGLRRNGKVGGKGCFAGPSLLTGEHDNFHFGFLSFVFSFFLFCQMAR